MVVGEQQRLTDFFSSGRKQKETYRYRVRLVRIRKPWGKREWKGEWSVSNDKWTRVLRKYLGGQSFAKGDGTIFMSFEDMLERFHHRGVAKWCRKAE